MTEQWQRPATPGICFREISVNREFSVICIPDFVFSITSHNTGFTQSLEFLKECGISRPGKSLENKLDKVFYKAATKCLNPKWSLCQLVEFHVNFVLAKTLNRRNLENSLPYPLLLLCVMMLTTIRM